MTHAPLTKYIKVKMMHDLNTVSSKTGGNPSVSSIFNSIILVFVMGLENFVWNSSRVFDNIDDNDTLICDDIIEEYEKSDKWCKPLWDTKLCWPTATLNETIVLPCPMQEYENQTASRTCILYDDSIRGLQPLWTEANYSFCKDPDNYTGLYLSIARGKYNEIRDKMWEHAVLTLSQFSYFVSFVVLIIALTVFIIFKKLRNARTRLHMHMFAATMMQTVMWLMHSFLFDNQLLSAYMYLEVLSEIKIDMAIKMANDYSHIVEKMFTRFNSHPDYIVIAGLERYFETATLFWLLMEGWFLYELICRSPLETKTSIKRYVIIGWGLPIILTTPWMAVHSYSSFNDVYWVNHDITVHIIAVSIFITFVINLFFFTKITGVLYTKMKLSGQMQQKKMEHKKWVRSTFMLVLLFGAQNVLYCIWFFVDKTKPKLLFLLIIKVVSSFQGIFVSLMYCFLNGEVRTVMKRNLSNK